MFSTPPEAEYFVPESLKTVPGERSWRFLEFGLYLPIFLVAVRMTEGDLEIGRHFLFGQISDVLDLAAQQCDNYSIAYIQLLSPGYMNTSNGYEMKHIKEIWRDKKLDQNLTFVMADGRRVEHVFNEHEDEERTRDMELVLAI